MSALRPDIDALAVARAVLVIDGGALAIRVGDRLVGILAVNVIASGDREKWLAHRQEALAEALIAYAPAPAAEPPRDKRQLAILSPYRQELADKGHCMADDDGDCTWAECPQLRDDEPRKSGRHCPRDEATRKAAAARGENWR